MYDVSFKNGNDGRLSAIIVDFGNEVRLIAELDGGVITRKHGGVIVREWDSSDISLEEWGSLIDEVENELSRI